MKIKNIYITLILLISIVFNSIAVNNIALLDSAKNNYKNKNYEKALKSYKSILKSGYEAADVYYNMGNCYYKLDSIPYAILYYEKAKLLSPNDDDILFNLKIANLKTIDKLDVLPKFFLTEWFDNFIDIFNTDTWAYISISSFIIFLLLILLFFFSRKISLKRLSFYFSLFFLIISFMGFSFSKKQKNKITQHNYAIIITPTVTAKSSPDDSGTDAFIIHEGVKVKLQDKVGEWSEIKLSDGSVGWIKTSDFKII